MDVVIAPSAIPITVLWVTFLTLHLLHPSAPPAAVLVRYTSVNTLFHLHLLFRWCLGLRRIRPGLIHLAQLLLRPLPQLLPGALLPIGPILAVMSVQDTNLVG